MLRGRDVEYTADGTVMAGRLFLPGGEGRRPAVLVAHEAGGLSEHELGRARQLAGLGYVTFVMDYHGSARAGTDAEIEARLAGLESSPDRMRAISRAALELLTAEPRTDPARAAAIGYCFGAMMMLELARDRADLKAVIGFHPGWFGSGPAGRNPEDSRNITGKVLMCVGSEDPWMTAQHRLAFEEEMRAAGADWQVNLYGGARHAFTNPARAESGVPGVGYHKTADIRSWQAMIALLDEVFAA